MKKRPLALLLFSLMFVAGTLRAAIPSLERQALIALYNATGGDSWTNKTGWKTPPLDTDGFAMPGTENTWYGVTVNAPATAVTAIDLANNNLNGTIPTQIGNLSGLVTLNLRGNARLTGTIPSSLGNLTNLQVLQLYQDQLSGSIPTELGNLTQLTRLNLYLNQLSGSIPSSLGSLIHLQVLSLYGNTLTGSIPTELGNLTGLTTLDLHSNQLSGTIPASLGNLTALQSLMLQTNQLTGAIPTELGNLSALQLLNLQYNQLSGPIPASLGGLSHLTQFIAGNNGLSGTIPSALGNLAQLVTLDLRFNALTGSIPASFGGLDSIQTLLMEFNQLSGPIPPELGLLTTLVDIRLHANQLTGTIPVELGNLANLQVLYLQINQLSGPIPPALGNLENLRSLRLLTNDLSGTIPSEVGALTQLTELSLNDNALEGPIPAGLGNLVNLEALNLFSNKLSGPIPASLVNLTLLDPESTNLSYNALYTSDPAVEAFLAVKDPDWAATQTVAPKDVMATPFDGASIRVSWTPIAYSSGNGRYEVLASTTAGGPYASAGSTVDKTVSSFQVSGLTAGQRYYFVVRTQTDAHAGNTNAVTSGYSAEASAVARTQVVQVTGTVLAGTTPLAGVVMSGFTETTLTNASGVYTGAELPGWSGTVTPVLSGYTFTPASRTYSGITLDQTAQNYAASTSTGSITVTAPNGGESWVVGTTHNVTWTQTGLTGTVTIDLYKGGVYRKTLGTANATVQTFSWSIALSEMPGSDYTILVWQGGVSDESAADFALRRRPRVDFDNDGQEDLLWRYQGTGTYQGWNVVWLMNQAQGLSPVPLAIAQDGANVAVPPAALTSPFPNEARPEAGFLEARGPGRTATAPVGIGDSLATGPTRVMRDPQESDRAPRWRPVAFNPPTAGVTETAASVEQGTVGIAALAIDGYLYLQTISDLAWEIAGTGDFDGDGDTDILWRNYGAGTFGGWNVIWYMNGGAIQSYGYLYGITDSDWKIVGTGDFDADGDIDILWRNQGTGTYSGWNVVWYMNGEAIQGYGYLYGITDLDWKIAGAGDFDSDGDIDILWRNTGTGTYGGWNVIWYMNGEAIEGYGYLVIITDLGWQIGGTGDFNADGYVDILWRNHGTGSYQGWNCIWYMQGETIIGYDYPMTITDTNWRIVNR